MKLMIESTKTNVGMRKLHMTEDVARRFRGIIEDGRNRDLRKWWIGIPESFLRIKMKCRWWWCIENTGSIVWSSDIMTFTGRRCRTLLPASAVVSTVATWRSPAWIQRRYSIWWGIQTLAWRWYLHASWLEECNRWIEADGGTGRCQKRTGEG